MVPHMIGLYSLVKNSLGQQSLTLNCTLVQVIKTIIWQVGPYVHLVLGIVICSSSWFNGYVSRHRVAEARCWDDSIATFYNMITNKLAILPALVAGAPFSGREISYLKRLHQELRTNDNVSSHVTQIIESLPEISPAKTWPICGEDIHKLEELFKVEKPTTNTSRSRDTLSVEEMKAYDFFQALLVLGEWYHKEYLTAWVMKVIDDACGFPDHLKSEMRENGPDQTYLIPYQIVSQGLGAPKNYKKKADGVRKNCKNFKNCEECVAIEMKIFTAYNQLLKALPGHTSALASGCKNTRHNFVLESIQSIQMEKHDALKKREDALKKQDEAGRKNDALNKKIIQKDRVLLEKDSVHMVAQENSDRRIQELQDQLRALSLTVDIKNNAIHKERQETEKVKGDWQKKLQKSFDKNSKLDKQLQAEKSAHQVTKLDSSAIQTELDQERAKTGQYKANWKENSTRFKDMKTQNDEFRAQALSLRSNDLAEKARTNAAVRVAVQIAEDAKDKEIAQFRKMYQDTSRELAELRDSREKEFISFAEERQSELGIQVTIQRSVEEKLEQERQKRVALEEEVAVITTQKTVAEEFAMWAFSRR